MHINDLPYDILAAVLRAALPETKNQAAQVKEGLGLLSVCRTWRAVALPAAYDTAFIECDAEGIATTLDLVVGAKCPRVVRRLVVDVFHQGDPFPGLEAVIARLGKATDKWTGIRTLELNMYTDSWGIDDRTVSAADHADDVETVSGALAALLPGLREINLGGNAQTQVTCELFGRLTGLYANQLQVLHSRHALAVPQDRVFARLRDVKIEGPRSQPLEYQLPRLDPEAIESLVLNEFTANDMWSMFCADADGHSITFPRLANLSLEYRRGGSMIHEQLSCERPWALRFPAAKRVRVVCNDTVCPSMENAVFPARLDALSVSAGLDVYRAIASAKVQVSRELTLSTKYSSDENNAKIGCINRIFTTADSCKQRMLGIVSSTEIPLGLFTYSRLTHMRIAGPTSMDSMVEHIRRQPHLLNYTICNLNLADTHTGISIPECTEHEPVAPLDTQINRLVISFGSEHFASDQAALVVKYLLLRIPTLGYICSTAVSQRLIQDFVDTYAQWYSHLATVKLALNKTISNVLAVE